ncbi:MAG: peptidylprolyl isomerase [Pricia sp.]|nr:peptidylprolyl isomerase [Pricia sp.]
MMVNRAVALCSILIIFWSCNNDDGGTVAPDPARPLSEVLAEDEVKIQEYLQTHFYNYAEFENPPEDFDYRIVLQEIPEGNTDTIPLIDQIQSIEIAVPSEHYLIPGEEGTVTHKLYYLSAREGVGPGLTVADSSFVRYEGSLLDGTVFDSNNMDAPVWFDLAALQAPATSTISGTAARGFSEGVRNFKSGGAPIINDDGTYTVENFGVGLIIFPSGLGYYNLARSVIPSYSPLLFKIDLFAVNQTDHDGDDTISIDEDTNGDGYLFNDDADGDGLPDYLDSDTN